ncbi:MAG: ATP-grasp domain-containing protein [Planctomycetaceae bacterium]|nr:ATP-grasp domain-containing protein [Planctomycetaceae bacterium]
MARTLAADFKKADTEVWSLIDSRLEAAGAGQFEQVGSADEERDAFMRRAAAAEWTVVIAPEFAGNLLRRCQWVLEEGGRLLSPGPATVSLASDKHRTAEHLDRHGIRTPRGVVIDGAGAGGPTTDLFPAVIKPLDGCGSQGVQFVAELWQLRALLDGQLLRLERFIPGLAASVAVLCGPSLHVALPPCEQTLGGDGQFAYVGGRTPLPDPLALRARNLALRTVRSLPDPLGYVGVDLILGADPDGSGDHVIEVNPRLTTSYVGLRALCRNNLAAAMLAVAQDQEPALSWHDGTVEFSADGRVAVDEQTLTNQRRI